MFEFISKDYPLRPGVYLMKDAAGKILYVGKAKELRKRLASYFREKADHTSKTRSLLARVERVDILLTDTEKEAFLLEESLIKKHRPRYNIVLRDDKRYLVFKIDKRHDYPRLSITRRISRDGSAYFGPYTSALKARETMRIVNRVFPLRKCRDTVFKNRVRPCLYYDMGQCLGPCVLDIDKKEYAKLVARVEMLLSGRPGDLLETLQSEMRSASENLEFERAAALRDQSEAVRRTVERQAAVMPAGGDLDAVAPVMSEKGLALGVAFVRQGRLTGQKSFFWPGLTLEEAPEAVAGFLAQFYGPGRIIPPRILIPWPLDEPALAAILAERRGGRVSVAAARKETEKRLLEIARENALRDAAAKTAPSPAEALAAKLGLAEPPSRVECVDISHLGGKGVRAGVAVYVDGRPRPEEYRAYSLKQAEGTGDDYLALAEWAGRRVRSGPPWPDLLLVDGGRGQLAAVVRALDDACGGNPFPLASIAKAGRRAGELEDVVFLPGRKNPVAMKPGSPELLFLQRLRDAAHRFSLGRQKQVRSGEFIKSDLASLPGVGPKTARLLWDKFGSVQAMSEADLAALMELPGVGRKKAEMLRTALARLGNPQG